MNRIRKDFLGEDRTLTDEQLADELLDNLVAYLGARFGLIPRVPLGWNADEREETLRKAIVGSLAEIVKERG